MKMPHLENGKKTTLTIDTINFKFKGYNMRQPLYHAGFVYYNNNPVLNKVPTDKFLANYVLPSVQNLNELNQYSRIESLNGIQITILKLNWIRSGIFTITTQHQIILIMPLYGIIICLDYPHTSINLIKTITS